MIDGDPVKVPGTFCNWGRAVANVSSDLRVDFRQDPSGRFKVLEVNPNPDITPGSGAAIQAAAAGLTYSKFIEKIIGFALK